MKSLIMVVLIIVAFSCSSPVTAPKEAMKDTATATTSGTTSTTAMNYAYTIQHPDNWEMGSNANTAAALNSLKAWENAKMDESMTYFADSVRVQFDGLDKTMLRDSVKSLFTSGRNAYKTVQITMEDWESVISKDKSEEWVTMWYKQQWVDNKGKSDSVEVINDVKFKEGKIVRLDEYTRKLH